MPEPETLGARGADIVVGTLERAVEQRRVAHVALTGGSTAGHLYNALARGDFRSAVWTNVHLWWGDDRFVGFADADSNVRLVRETLLADGTAVGADPAHVHPFPIDLAFAAGETAEWCAKRYADELAAVVPIGPAGAPVFDLVLLGVGADGHLLSCFPGSPLIDAPAPPICAATPPPTTALPALPRVTCSPRIVDAARTVLVVVAGSSKAAVVQEILGAGAVPERRPAAIAVRNGATWLIDAAAAALLGDDVQLATS